MLETIHAGKTTSISDFKKNPQAIIDAAQGESIALLNRNKTTSFEAPTFTVGRVTYYGVDHTPSYLWQSASWEISRVVTPFVPTVLGGPAAWDGNETIRRAIEIREGVVCNETILSFQNRETDYPHRIVRL